MLKLLLRFGRIKIAMKIIEYNTLKDKMREFVKELLDYDNLSISFDENCLCIGVVYEEVKVGEKAN